MNIMNYLTRRHMFGNRRRTIMTICGVIVSVAMITAVTIGAQSFMGLMQKAEMRDSGTWHTGVKNVTYEQAMELGKKENVKDAFLTKPGSYAVMENYESQNKDKPYVYVRGFEKKAFDGLAIRLASGRLPEKADEIVVGEHLIKNGGVDLKIGDQLTLNLGERFLVDNGVENILGTDTMYLHADEAEGIAEEEFRVLETRTYTVVGIVERPASEGWLNPGYSCFGFFEPTEGEENINAYFSCDKVKKGIMEQAVSNAKEAGVEEEQVFYNNSLLRYYGISGNAGFVHTIEVMETILIVIIMIGSISLIYNSFAISISERSKQFGMLSSVGATRKQKRNAVFYEGAVIGGIAIPLGLLSGVLGMAITFSVVRSIFSTITPIPLTLEIAWEPFLLAIGVSVLTIFLSAWIPARRASRISAIDAIRQTQDVKVRGKKLRTGFWVRWLFGLPGELALKNLKRNRKRYAALVFSLFISLVLFITVGTYVTVLSDSFSAMTDAGDGDVIVYFSNSGNKAVYDKIAALDGIKDSSFVTKIAHRMPISEKFSYELTEDYRQCYKKQLESWGWEKEAISEEMAKLEQQMTVLFTVIPDDAFLEYAKNAKLSSDREALNQAILVNFLRARMNGYQTDCKIFKSYGKEKLTVWDIDVDRYNDEEERREITVPILGVTTETPFGIDCVGSVGNTEVKVIISQTLLETMKEKLTPTSEASLVDEAYFAVADSWDSGNDAEAEKILTADPLLDFNYYNRKESIEENERFLLIISIFAYGFIVLISLICIANLCNTISTSFALRRREFAMLKSMGMEPKAFSRMLRYECLFYGIKALAFGVPVSIGIGYWMHKTMEGGVYSTAFTLPLHIYAIGIGAVLIVVFTAMGYGAGKVRKDTIVEGLKSEAE